MLWRVRTTMADRPGALARLAARCGERSVNILALQIFPGIGGVTDELVLKVPDGWRLTDVAELVESAGGTAVSAGPCTEQALVDGPTRYLTAVRQVLHGAEPAARVLARLLDAEPADTGSHGGVLQDVLTVVAAGEQLTVRRTTPFTATEHARAHAFAETLSDLDAKPPAAEDAAPVVGAAAQPVVRVATMADAAALTAMHGRCSAETVRRSYGVPLARLDARLARRLLVGGSGALVVAVGDQVVGLAALGDLVEGRCELSLMVEDAWQGQGLGTRLLAAAARLAARGRAEELLLRGPAESPAAVAMVFASGLRARVRLAGDELLVTVSARGLSPLPRTHADSGVPLVPEPA
jgi:GNAT superfamily N-acetyltransferase